VQTDSDQNVYIGSSNCKLFTYGYTGVNKITNSSKKIVPSHDGRSLQRHEIGNKTSFHGSGIVNLASETDGRRDRLRIRALRDEAYSLPLAGILPMEPNRYPLSAKSVRSADLCLPDKLKSDLPIGVLIYITSHRASDPPPISAAKLRLPLTQEISRPLGEYVLHALVYSDPIRLPCWPTEEVQVIAHPKTDGEEPSWVFFA
tara:strand:+ start:2741 stop:3346 length:606 start_codon:yes stop_codon:yes gene_type:complete